MWCVVCTTHTHGRCLQQISQYMTELKQVLDERLEECLFDAKGLCEVLLIACVCMLMYVRAEGASAFALVCVHVWIGFA